MRLPQGHARQPADFADAIREGRQPRVDGEEGRKAAATIEAICRSTQTGRVATV